MLRLYGYENFSAFSTFEKRASRFTWWQSLVMLYRCLYDKGAPYISEYFNFKDVPCNLRGLDQPLFNLEFMHRSFTFLTSKLWNALPPIVRESQDIASFKRSLKDHMA